MKLSSRQAHPARRQNGSLVFVYIALLSLMMVFLAVNSGTLFRLHGEVRVIEKQQLERWSSTQTNMVSATTAAK